MSANVKLSQKEIELVTNTDFILTKNNIIKKVQALFGVVAADFEKIIQDYGNFLPTEIATIPPKISKGENYEGLPYVMLDYPRCFAKEDVFAVRCFFWWGNFFSINLQLQGKYLNLYESKLQQHLSEQLSDYAVCIYSDPWKHDFSEENFLPAKSISNPIIFKQDFIKIATKIPLSEWDNAYIFYTENFKRLMQALLH